VPYAARLMTQQAHPAHYSISVDAGRQVAQLRHVLRLVEELAERFPPPRSDEAALDEAARVTSAYDHALPIVQRRFDALAGETAAWSTAAVEALLAAGEMPTTAPARRLADELEKALTALTKLLRP
jgi:hypothetical protein